MSRLLPWIAPSFLLLFVWVAVPAKEVYRQKGLLADMQSVACGYAQKSGPTVAGAIFTGSQHTKSRELLCQEYTLKADRVTYRIRPKDEKHPVLLPVGEQAEFRLKKDEMLLRIPESDTKEREYFVVSMTASAELKAEIDNSLHPPKPHSEQPASRTALSVGPSSPADAPSAPTPTPVMTSAPATGLVEVRSAPADAEVFVDSRPAGRTPLTLKLVPGLHSFQVVMSGYQDWVTQISVASGTQQQVMATLAQ